MTNSLSNLTRVAALLAALSLFTVGCVTADDVREALDDANYCHSVGECLPISPGCPFGCTALINVTEEDEIRELLADYHDRQQQTCEYDCVDIGPIRCEAGRCVAEYLE